MYYSVYDGCASLQHMVSLYAWHISRAPLLSTMHDGVPAQLLGW
jgi:hypothetical protein